MEPTTHVAQSSPDLAARVEEPFRLEEVRLAARNHALPLEALRYPITPTGLHYLLIHFDIPDADSDSWRLTVDGQVERPLTLTLDDLKARPSVTVPVTMECAGNGRALLAPRPVSQPWLSEAVGTAEWTGTPLAPLLEDAGLRLDVVDVVFTGMDRGIDGGVEQDYQRSLSREEALREGALLVYAMNGAPLPPQHGYPLRLVAPGWYGMAQVKWLRGITALGEPLQGYQQARAYHLRATPDEPGEPVTRMAPRALMEPPGMPDFLSRTRYLMLGRPTLRGRAWSGQGQIARVEVSLDGGATWQDARLGEAPSPYAWVGWSFEWDAQPGTYDLCCRATDTAGHTQPTQPHWNTGGYMNNAIQRVPVVVR